MRNTTETEATEKWCPFVRDPGNANATCIGSRCMMWRWATRRDPNSPYFQTGGGGTDTGYCGLAGPLSKD